jgi:hypothetical protein
MSDEKVTYYAIVGRGATIDDPHGIVRRRQSPEIGILDEALHRDLEWHRTGIIIEWEYSNFSDELEEVDKEKALQIVEAIRTEGPH